ncbi:MAG TPA: FtsX-like permease family protein, partial [Micromonosporaceae bacterium]
MLSLVFRALRARRAQSLVMFALAMFAALGAAAAPWFLAWGVDAVAQANIASTPVTDRLVTATATVPYQPGGPNPVQFMRDQVAQHLSVPDAQPQVGARVLASIKPASPTKSAPGTDSISAYVVYRDDVCSHVLFVSGSCPGQGEVMLADSVASPLGIGVGDQVRLGGATMATGAVLRVAGVYNVRDAHEAYWIGAKLLPELGETSTADPAVVSEQTLLGLPLDGMDIEAHLVLPDSAFTDLHFDLNAELAQAAAALHQQGIDVTTSFADLLTRIIDDRLLVVLGVGIGTVQLVLLCWVGLFLAVRHTSQERRLDIGLFKLRGARTRRVWALVALQSGLPMLAGTVVGVVVGFAAAAGLANSVGGSVRAGVWGVARSSVVPVAVTVWVSVAAAVVAGLGGLVAALAAEGRTIRTPVGDLLRGVPARQRGWRASVAELVVVVLAGAGVYQARVEAGKGGQASALVLLAPALLGLAVALVVAWALVPLAGRVGGWALRAGRVGVALAALQVARRRGMHRVFAVLAVAAAVFTTTGIVWHAASGAWRERAVQEVGADRVLSVDAASAAALLAAVRAVDPEGRYAMAVASALGEQTSDRVVAVDSTRLARVGRFPAALPAAGDLAALLRPAAPAPPVFADGPVSLDAAGPRAVDELPAHAVVPVGLLLHLSTVDGEPVQVGFAALAPGRHSVQATVKGCPDGCRLVGIEVTGAS